MPCVHTKVKCEKKKGGGEENSENLIDKQG